MAKRKQHKKRRPREPVVTVDYADDDGNVLRLRESLSPGTIKMLGPEPALGAAASAEDIWQRRMEMLFERLAVSWDIAGLPLDDQALLVGRYRMADVDTQRWVQRTIEQHLEQHIPDLRRR